MIIVSGRLFVRAGRRAEFLKLSQDAVALARQAPGCTDFVVAADVLEPDRVNVYEEWASEKHLLDFRNAGPDNGMFSLIERFEVARHVVASSGPP